MDKTELEKQLYSQEKRIEKLENRVEELETKNGHELELKSWWKKCQKIQGKNTKKTAAAKTHNAPSAKWYSQRGGTSAHNAEVFYQVQLLTK